jgi:hypothetical protein
MTFSYISLIITRNECQSYADMRRIIQDLGVVYKRPKLELEKGIDYEEKKNKIDRYKKIFSALLKKDSTRI